MKKQKSRRNKSERRGTSSAVLLSIAIHAGLFLLAGMLVVFTVQKTKEPEFEAPQPVERRKMDLRKPKPRIKKSQPKMPNRIVSQRMDAKINVQLPDMGGDFGNMDGDFDIMDMDLGLDTISTLGTKTSIGNDLVGNYWDCKYTRDGLWAPPDNDEWRADFYKFFHNDWNPKYFDRYFKSPDKLYATFLLLPPSISAMAPAAFGIADDMCSGGFWFIHYKGQISSKDGITFRFWVSVDDTLAIRINRKVVVAASFFNRNNSSYNRASMMFGNTWLSTDPQSLIYEYGLSRAIVGDWITLEPGELYDMEVVAADNDFDTASFVVMVEEEGVEYEQAWHRGPLLPLFRTAELTHEQLDQIFRLMPAQEVNPTNGPLFRDF